MGRNVVEECAMLPTSTLSVHVVIYRAKFPLWLMTPSYIWLQDDKKMLLRRDYVVKSLPSFRTFRYGIKKVKWDEMRAKKWWLLSVGWSLSPVEEERRGEGEYHIREGERERAKVRWVFVSFICDWLLPFPAILSHSLTHTWYAHTHSHTHVHTLTYEAGKRKKESVGHFVLWIYVRMLWDGVKQEGRKSPSFFLFLSLSSFSLSLSLL